MWAYNTQPYFESVGQTAKQIGTYMSWVPLVGGSIGVILGGKVSDFLMKRLGLFARVLVLTVSQVRQGGGQEGGWKGGGGVCVCLFLPACPKGRLFLGSFLSVQKAPLSLYLSIFLSRIPPPTFPHCFCRSGRLFFLSVRTRSFPSSVQKVLLSVCLPNSS